MFHEANEARFCVDLFHTNAVSAEQLVALCEKYNAVAPDQVLCPETQTALALLRKAERILGDRALVGAASRQARILLSETMNNLASVWRRRGSRRYGDALACLQTADVITDKLFKPPKKGGRRDYMVPETAQLVMSSPCSTCADYHPLITSDCGSLDCPSTRWP